MCAPRSPFLQFFFANRPADGKINDIIVTGTFDNWSKTLPLVKRPDGSFELEVPIPKELKTVEFKFVLNDKEWVTSDEYWTIIDETGNKNNYIEFDDSGKIIKGSKNDAINGGKTEAGKTEMGKTIIPESGLAMGAPTPAGDVVAESNLDTTVMPSQEGVQTTLGEPGAVVPENPQDIAAFKEVRNVDAKELNAQIKEEEAEKAATVAADAEPAKPKYVKKVKKLVPKAEAEAKESTAAATSKPAPGSSTTSGSTAAKKEKKGIFSRIKKALQ